MRAVLDKMNDNRKIWAADSFMGVPPARDPELFPEDLWHKVPPFAYAVSLERVKGAFAVLDLLSDTEDRVPPQCGSVGLMEGGRVATEN